MCIGIWYPAYMLILFSLQVCIIELGGTIGDIEGMPFVEAFRQFQFKVGRENFCLVHVSLVPKVKIFVSFLTFGPLSFLNYLTLK